MSLFDYRISRQIAAEDHPFDALILAAMRKADDTNERLLRSVYPELWDELKARYQAPGGIIPSDPQEYQDLLASWDRSTELSSDLDHPTQDGEL